MFQNLYTSDSVVEVVCNRELVVIDIEVPHLIKMELSPLECNPRDVSSVHFDSGQLMFDEFR